MSTRLSEKQAEHRVCIENIVLQLIIPKLRSDVVKMLAPILNAVHGPPHLITHCRQGIAFFSGLGICAAKIMRKKERKA
jgi:hypothetical protein